MAGIRSYLIHLVPDFPFPINDRSETGIHTLSFFFMSFTFFVFFFSFSLYKLFKKTQIQQYNQQLKNPVKPEPFKSGHSLDGIGDKTHQSLEKNPTHLTNSILLELLPSDSPKWASLFCEDGKIDPDSRGWCLYREMGNSSGKQIGKKKRKRAKKKKSNLQAEDRDGDERENSGSVLSSQAKGPELICLYPFTSSSSATQRKIKRQFDELVHCHESKGLTLAQVGQFANCLNNARDELQHKADTVQRKFTITKALLYKADRSSFDRLRQQIYKLEMEQKRLEEDAFVYNWLQQQLKLSPAYNKMLEIGSCMEFKPKSEKSIEDTDSEFNDISFEELLAQEKKDSFWLDTTAEKWEIKIMLERMKVQGFAQRKEV